MTILEKVTQLASQRFDIELEKITPETTLKDLGSDSLNVVELIMELEEEFGLQIEDEDAERISTIGDAVAYIEANQ